MAQKDEPARLDAERYSRRFKVRTLYSDMDAFRHLNNGATGRYLEEGRADLNMHVFGDDCLIDPPGGLQLLFASVNVDYLAQGHYPGEIEVGSGLSRIGNSSYVIAQGAFQRGQCIALAESAVIKAIDGKPCRLSDPEIAALRPMLLAG